MQRTPDPMISELLIYDDNVEIVEFLGQMAKDKNLKFFPAMKDEEFWKAFDQMTNGAIVLDLDLPESSGIAILEQLAARACTAPIVLISGYHEDILKSAERLGVKDGLDIRAALCKPFRPPPREPPRTDGPWEPRSRTVLRHLLD